MTDDAASVRRQMIPDGYTDVGPRKIVSVVTYLEMLARPPLADLSSGLVSLRRVHNPALDWYRNLYRRVGAQWLWFSRLVITNGQLSDILNRATTELYVAEHEAKEIGMAELDRSNPPHVEITSFALFPEAIGKGFGRAFMAALLDRAWIGPTERVWLHTCNLDSPAALSFYQKCGFRPYKCAVEVADDPRLRGILPEDAAPQAPIIR